MFPGLLFPLRKHGAFVKFLLLGASHPTASYSPKFQRKLAKEERDLMILLERDFAGKEMRT
jgi:hypothetical protein